MGKSRALEQRSKYYSRKEAGLCKNNKSHIVWREGVVYCAECKDKMTQQRTIDTVDRKRQAMAGYGSKCACCGDSRSIYLQFDHVNNDGKEHRKKIRCGWHLYTWIIRNNYPSIIQLLCANCHYAKTQNGGCGEAHG